MKKLHVLIPSLMATISMPLVGLVGCGEKPTDECMLTFVATEGGHITSAASFYVKTGSKWATLPLPQYEADQNYYFVGWFNGEHEMKGDDVISSNMTITAKFEFEQTPITDFNWYFDGDYVTMTEYKGMDSNIVVPKKVTFNGKTYTVNKIGDGAFKNKTNVITVSLPNTITSIGDSAFWCCEKLTQIKIPESVTNIGNWAFNDCAGLTQVSIPEGVRSIREHTFDNCKGLTQVSIQEGVTSIGTQAFSNCDNLTQINIPESVTSVSEGAFYFCGLTSITIPKKLTNLAAAAFVFCNNLKNIKVADGNKVFTSKNTLGNECNCILKHDGDENMLFLGIKDSIIPNDITSIGYGAFSGCPGLTEIVIPDSVTSIGWLAFSACEDLKDITIGNGVKVIEKQAFCYCSKATQATYTGTKEQWDAIELADGWNGNITKVVDLEGNVIWEKISKIK